MNAQVARWLETIRQRALTKRLGQVTCRTTTHDWLGEWAIPLSCPDCGAIV